MVSPKYTRTVNPLQFEALEPKRFEDLVRQLLYDFRAWRALEPTGRLGGDDGFDARGWEVADGSLADATSDEDEEIALRQSGDRIWLVQCKRERAIGPGKLLSYLDAIPPVERSQLHGLIFAACSDFSKRARDAFRSWCVKNSIGEFYLWGKAELEDALFQPKNDHLLFAYFGLSLTIRRRSDQARLRAQTTIKRKLKRAITDKYEILLRDVADESYPYASDGSDDHAWWVYSRPKMTFRGLECLHRRYFAYRGDEDKNWDVANALNDARLGTHADPWRGTDAAGDDRAELFAFWHSLPEKNKAWFEVWGVVPFSSIVEIDELGDDITSHPHIYFEPAKEHGHPFSDGYPELSTASQWGSARVLWPKAADRIVIFPEKFRKPLLNTNGDEV